MELAHLERLARQRPYSFEAYQFVLRGLDFTIHSLDVVRHVSGPELVEGIREFAQEEFGPMAKHVLNTWGMHRTRDFGEIVFDLVDAGFLRTTEEDSIEDFTDCYDFGEVFERGYYCRRVREATGDTEPTSPV